MIYLVGGPPRVGKSTLALIVLEEAGIPYCSTDMIVGMLEVAAPELGVRHGFHADKANSMTGLLTHFVCCADIGNDAYLIEGDVITPAFAQLIAPQLSEMRAVFLGNSALTLDDLRHAPDWLENSETTEYEMVRREVVARSQRLRAECEQLGYAYVEMSQDRDASFAAALKALDL
jgi:cytidylate kinase